MACAVTASTGIEAVRGSARSRPSVSTPSASGRPDVHEDEVGAVLDRQLDRLCGGRRLERAVVLGPEQVTEQLHVLLVVLDDEDARTRHDEPTREGSVTTTCSPAELAVDPDSPAVQLDEPLRQRQAEAGPSPCSTPGLGLLELLEDSLVVLGGDARAGVGDRDPHLAVDPRRRRRPPRPRA